MGQRKYGETFLTKVRVTTTSELRARKSFFVWGAKKDTYTLSLIGIINGFLTKIGLALTAHVDKDTREVVKYKIVKKWWG